MSGGGPALPCRCKPHHEGGEDPGAAGAATGREVEYQLSLAAGIGYLKEEAHRQLSALWVATIVRAAVERPPRKMEIPAIPRRVYGLRDEEYVGLEVLTCTLPET